MTRNRLTEALEEARKQEARDERGPILDLTLSNPTRARLSYNEPTILRALTSQQSLDYDPQPKGLIAAREAVAEYYASQQGIRAFSPERLILTTSTSEGYSFVFRLLCNAGDEILVPKPSYPLFEFLADLQDVKLVPYPLIYDHGWQMDFPSLERAVTTQTRAVVVVHPNNPTGSYVQPHERNLLDHFARDHGLAIVADEVFLDYAFCDYAFDKAARESFAGNPETLTFTLSGVSKISALPQMKLAWVATSGPEEQVTAAMARLEVIADTYLSMNAPIQWAASSLLEQRKTVKPQLMKRVLGNLAEMDRQLAAQTTIQRLSVQGGWYAVLRVPVTQTDEELAVQILRTKSVLVHPGHFYDFPADGYLVLSLITPCDDFANGVARVIELCSG